MLTEADKFDLPEKRMGTLARAWLSILEKIAVPDKRLFVLNPALASKVIRHYVNDLEHLKRRYGIPERAQPPKVAGLMAGAILKYRPLVPADGWDVNVEDSPVNEYLAIFHGIAVCAQYDNVGHGNRAMAALMAKPCYRLWLDRFLYLLRERNYTSESLIMTFETLCMAAFPDSLTEGA